MNAPRAKVGDLSEQIRGVSYEKQDASTIPQPGYLPILRANNITDDGLVFDDLVFVPAERVGEKQRIRQHDIVVAASSGSLDVVGKAAPALTDFNGGFGAFCKVLRPNSKVHPGYFAHFFKTQHYRQSVSSLATGANINNLRNEHLDGMEIPLPTLVEQRRITEVLDRAETLRVKRRAALAQLDTLAHAVFLNLFSNPLENRRGWPSVELQEIAVVERGKFTPRPRNDQTYYGGRFPFIQTGDISNSQGRLNSWSQTLNEKGVSVSRSFPAGTVVIAIVGATIGMSAILDIEVYCPDSVVGIQARETKTVPEYIEMLLRYWRPIFLARAPETARANINLETLRPLKIPLPPLSMQREFARRMLRIEKLKKAHRASLVEMDTLFAVLQHRAFRGEL